MANYEPAVLERWAEKLYSRARLLALSYGVAGALIGGCIGAAVAFAMKAHGSDQNAFVIGAASLGLAVGIAEGFRKSFMLRLEAQRTLCQLEIEKNTRTRVHEVARVAVAGE
jgi:glucose-6-phosphate-specific signal transduction histidine kinase